MLAGTSCKSDNIFAIASGKGGVGKTFLAVSLCQAWAQMNMGIMLFDGDLGLANVDVQLGLQPTRDLGHVIGGDIELKDAITRFTEGKFDVIAGRSGSGSLSQISQQKLIGIRRDLQLMARPYDAIVIDLGAGVSRQNLFMASSAVKLFVVTTEEATSLTDAYVCIKLARKCGLNNIDIIVNMAEDEKSGLVTYQTLLKTCRRFMDGYEPQLAGIVRRDISVRNAIRRQESLLSCAPSSNAALDVQQIAARYTISVVESDLTPERQGFRQRSGLVQTAAP